MNANVSQINTVKDMKEEILNIAKDLQKGVINAQTARTLLLGLLGVSQRSELLAFAKEMQNIGFNEMDDVEMVVDIYIKANCG